ncbi:MAG TPA: sugar MFS transporter [Nevskia sp.]|nr:sugar MFS transporter [Nevskia sp.]
MNAAPLATPQERTPLAPIIVIGALFFIFGFVTWLNGPLITFVKLAFDLDTDARAFLVTTAFYLSYFFLALPSSWILERTGMKKGMALGLLVMAAGAFVFGSFATARWYPGALGGLFVIGSGLSLLQCASNPYISVLGPIESAAQRISLMGICNKVAGIIAPLAIGSTVLSGIDVIEKQARQLPAGPQREALLNEFAAKVHVPYLLMAGILALLAVWILRSPLPEISAAQANTRPRTPGRRERDSIFQFPHLWLGVVCLFLYVGVEVMAGDAIGAYGRGFDLPVGQTKYFTTLTMSAMLVGYLAGMVAIPRFITQSRGLSISALLGVIFSVAAWLTTGYVSVGFVAALGLANALMWPVIFPLAIEGLGRFTERGSALLVMGIAGGAIIPRLFATMKEQFPFQTVFLAIMAPCYLYILYYALRGHRVGQD